MQWGVYDPFNSPNQWQPAIRERVTFPKPFPNKCLGVVITQKLKLHDVAWNNAVTQFDKNGFTVFCGTSENRAGFSYIAFGY